MKTAQEDGRRPTYVVYVDDYAFDRKLVRELLRREGNEFDLDEAATRAEFEALLAQGQYDIVLSDLHIVGFEGLEVLSLVETYAPGVAGSILTGTGSEEVAVEALKKGAADYVVKSMSHLRRLPATIRSVLEKQRFQQERAEAIRSLRESEERFRQIAENIQQVFLLYELEKRQYLYISPAFEQIWGRNRAAVCANSDLLVAAAHPEERDEIERQRTSQACLTRAFVLEYRIVRPDHEVRWVREQSFPVVGEDGAVYRRAVIASDITEHKRAEEMRLATERLQSELDRERELHRLRAQFISMINHDFRNPVTTIKLSIELLKQHAERFDEESRRRRLEVIEEQIDHVVQMMDDLADFGDTGSIQVQPVQADLNQLCRQIVNEFRSVRQDEQAVVYVGPKEPCLCNLDERLVTRAVSNLLANAAKYSPPSSVVNVRLTTDEHMALLSVSDQGQGIPREELTLVFDMFYRASNVGHVRGTGLGLAIVRQIMTLHGGSVEVDSQLGKGTTFTLRVPRLGE